MQITLILFLLRHKAPAAPATAKTGRKDKQMIIDTRYKIALEKNGIVEYHTFITSLTEQEFFNTLAGVYNNEVLKTIVVLEKAMNI